MKKKHLSNIVFEISLFFILIIYLFPVFLIVLNSFKPFKEIFESFISWPKSFYMGNYIKAWTSANFQTVLINNILITGLTVLGVITFTAMAGYKLSRDKSRLSWFFYMLFTFPFLIPLYTYMIPLIKLTKDLHLTNNIVGISLIYISTSSFSLFLIHGFVKSIPVELDESASIDGCSQLRLFFQIIFPLLKPAISTVAVLYSLWTWNDFLMPFLILTERNRETITINIYKMFGKFGSEWDVITASLVLATLPIIIIYIVLQKYIISGIAAGAVKG